MIVFYRIILLWRTPCHYYMFTGRWKILRKHAQRSILQGWVVRYYYYKFIVRDFAGGFYVRFVQHGQTQFVYTLCTYPACSDSATYRTPVIAPSIRLSNFRRGDTTIIIMIIVQFHVRVIIPMVVSSTVRFVGFRPAENCTTLQCV